jgi:hypothetical protein
MSSRNIQKLECPTSSRRPIIIIEHSAEAATASNRCGAISEIELRENERVTDALMVSFAAIMSNELSNGDPKRVLSEEDHALQTGFFNAADEALGIAIQVW